MSIIDNMINEVIENIDLSKKEKDILKNLIKKEEEYLSIGRDFPLEEYKKIVEFDLE